MDRLKEEIPSKLSDDKTTSPTTRVAPGGDTKAKTEPSSSLPAAQLLEVMIKEEDKELITLTVDELEAKEAEMRRLKYEMLKEFRCQTCGKYFHRAADLRRHSVSHTGIRPFVCPVCGKAFAQKPHLATHSLLHDERKPFPCPHCDKAYTQRQKLDSHIKIIHEKDRPYICDLCGKTFARPDTYRLHVKRHDGYRPFACHLCPRTFTQAYHYKNHMAIHTDSNTNICTLCDKSFADRGSLNRHRRRVHKIDTGGRDYRFPSLPVTGGNPGVQSVLAATSQGTDGLPLAPIKFHPQVTPSEKQIPSESTLKPGESNLGVSDSNLLTSESTPIGYHGDRNVNNETSLTTLRSLDVCEDSAVLRRTEPCEENARNSSDTREVSARNPGDVCEARVQNSSDVCDVGARNSGDVREDSMRSEDGSESGDMDDSGRDLSGDYADSYYYAERGNYGVTEPQYTSTLSDYLSQILASCRR